MTAKTRAIPSLSTGTIIRLKHQDRNGGRRVTQPPFIAEPLAFICDCLTTIKTQ